MAWAVRAVPLPGGDRPVDLWVDAAGYLITEPVPELTGYQGEAAWAACGVCLRGSGTKLCNRRRLRRIVRQGKHASVVAPDDDDHGVGPGDWGAGDIPAVLIGPRYRGTAITCPIGGPGAGRPSAA